MNPPLPPAVVWFHLLDMSTLSAQQLASYVDDLHPLELERYQRFLRPQRQQQFVCGRRLLRQALSQLLLLPVSAFELQEQPQQAPKIISPALKNAPGFSVSHSGNWVACAVSATARLGLDIEFLDATRELTKLSRQVFDVDEQAHWHAHPDKLLNFYQTWSTQEARFKLTQSHKPQANEQRYLLAHKEISIVLMSDQKLIVQMA